MSGNVSEWVYDWYGNEYYSDSPSENPTGSLNNSSKVLRGGSWDNNALFARSSDRYLRTPAARFNSIGFRCAFSDN